MIALETVDLALDIVLKLVFLAVLLILGYLFFRLDKAAKSLEKAAKNVERSSDTVEEVVSILRRIPFVGPKGERKDD